MFSMFLDPNFSNNKWALMAYNTLHHTHPSYFCHQKSIHDLHPILVFYLFVYCRFHTYIGFSMTTLPTSTFDCGQCYSLFCNIIPCELQYIHLHLFDSCYLFIINYLLYRLFTQHYWWLNSQPGFAHDIGR